MQGGGKYPRLHFWIEGKISRRANFLHSFISLVPWHTYNRNRLLDVFYDKILCGHGVVSLLMTLAAAAAAASLASSMMVITAFTMTRLQ